MQTKDQAGINVDSRSEATQEQMAPAVEAIPGVEDKGHPDATEIFKRWPIPRPILIEMIETQDELNHLRAQLDEVQAKVMIVENSAIRLQRIAAQMSGAPGDCKLMDIFVGFTPHDTPEDMIAAIAPQCAAQVAEEEREELARRWNKK